MEKKSQPMIFVGYCGDMKEYYIFDPFSKDVLVRRHVLFDEHFKWVSSPSPSTTCNVGYSIDHAHSFVYQEDDFVVEHNVTEDENYPESNQPSALEEPDHEQLDQE